MSETSSHPAIRLTDLRKEFGHMVAADGIDLVVPQGAVFG